MKDIIKKFTDKLLIKYFIYLNGTNFEIYSNPFKKKSEISKREIANHLYEVIEENIIDEERFFLIAAKGNDIGWVKVENPILIMNTYPEKVLVNDHDYSDLNESMGIYPRFNLDKIYTKKYLIIFEDNLYYGVTSENELMGFVPAPYIYNGNIKEQSFKFNSSNSTLYKDIYLNMNHKFLNGNKSYICDKYFHFKNKNIGSFKVGQQRYWFETEFTSMKESFVEYLPEKTIDELIIEHVFYTQKLEIEYNSDYYAKIKEEVLSEDSIKELKDYLKYLDSETKKLQLKNTELSDENEELKNINKILSETDTKEALKQQINS